MSTPGEIIRHGLAAYAARGPWRADGDNELSIVATDVSVLQEPVGEDELVAVEEVVFEMHVKRLKFSGFHFGKGAGEILARTVERKVTTLDLSRSWFAHGELPPIFSILADSSVHTLDLSFTNTGVLEAAKLSRSIDSVSCKLQTLTVSCNPITAEGVGMILKWGCDLSELTAEHCGILTQDDKTHGMDFLKEGLRENTSVANLQLGGNGFADTDIDSLREARVLNKRTNLTEETAAFTREDNAPDKFTLYINEMNAKQGSVAADSGLTSEGEFHEQPRSSKDDEDFERFCSVFDEACDTLKVDKISRKNLSIPYMGTGTATTTATTTTATTTSTSCTSSSGTGTGTGTGTGSSRSGSESSHSSSSSSLTQHYNLGTLTPESTSITVENEELATVNLGPPEPEPEPEAKAPPVPTKQSSVLPTHKPLVKRSRSFGSQRRAIIPEHGSRRKGASRTLATHSTLLKPTTASTAKKIEAPVEQSNPSIPLRKTVMSAKFAEGAKKASYTNDTASLKAKHGQADPVEDHFWRKKPSSWPEKSHTASTSKTPLPVRVTQTTESWRGKYILDEYGWVPKLPEDGTWGSNPAVWPEAPHVVKTKDASLSRGLFTPSTSTRRSYTPRSRSRSRSVTSTATQDFGRNKAPDKQTPAILNACLSGNAVCEKLLGSWAFRGLAHGCGEDLGVPLGFVPHCGEPDVLNKLKLGSSERVAGIAKLLYFITSIPMSQIEDINGEAHSIRYLPGIPQHLENEDDVVQYVVQAAVYSRTPAFVDLIKVPAYETQRTAENKSARQLLKQHKQMQQDVSARSKRSLSAHRSNSRSSLPDTSPARSHSAMSNVTYNFERKPWGAGAPRVLEAPKIDMKKHINKYLSRQDRLLYRIGTQARSHEPVELQPSLVAVPADKDVPRSNSSAQWPVPLSQAGAHFGNSSRSRSAPRPSPAVTTPVYQANPALTPPLALRHRNNSGTGSGGKLSFFLNKLLSK
eukprot:TRINITY_DN447_c1_g1_i1.p1 TRINITY_DN447_c1_g1~~TRINITY_DN447_c1_g1_i1.p1  ORF type:complete len:997 (+),score=190.82 TRINITY_DN447_c1_g1_i1:60-2993(+)